jgi:hypothetical protein
MHHFILKKRLNKKRAKKNRKLPLKFYNRLQGIKGKKKRRLMRDQLIKQYKLEKVEITPKLRSIEPSELTPWKLKKAIVIERRLDYGSFKMREERKQLLRLNKAA